MSAVVKPTGSLKAFLDAQKSPNTRLLGAVERHLLLAPAGDRDSRVLHPSEIVKHDWCHRASFYALQGEKPKTSNPALRLQNIFDEGHYIHAKWQDRFRAMGNLVGFWRCHHCADQWFGMENEYCGGCGAGPDCIDYTEVTLSSDREYRIKGHADGWVTGIGDDCLIEIKSMSIGTVRMESPSIFRSSGGVLDAAWGDIRRPFGTHVRQGALYLELGAQMVARGGHFVEFPEQIVFVYERKDNQGIKEFTVYRDYKTVEPILEAASKIVIATGRDVPPRCNLDSTSGCNKCKAYEEVL